MSKNKMFKFNVKNLKYSMDAKRFLYTASVADHDFVYADLATVTIYIDGLAVVENGVLTDVTWTEVLNTGITLLSLTKGSDVFSITTDGETKAITLTSINYVQLHLEAPKDLAYANSLTLEADYNETKLYGDGSVMAVLGDDKGKTGSIGVINIEPVYEIDCARVLEIANGYADIQQRASKSQAIYYEVEAYDNGNTITIKNWMFGCITGKPNESYQQTQDDPTINSYEYPLTVLGENLKTALAIDDVDTNGNNTKVFRVTVYPGDTAYDGFEDFVPIPQEV